MDANNTPKGTVFLFTFVVCPLHSFAFASDNLQVIWILFIAKMHFFTFHYIPLQFYKWFNSLNNYWPDLAAKPTGAVDLSAVSDFDKSKLKHATTTEKTALPTKADIEAEKKGH